MIPKIDNGTMYKGTKVKQYLEEAYKRGIEYGNFESRQLPEVVKMCEQAREKALKECLDICELHNIKILEIKSRIKEKLK